MGIPIPGKMAIVLKWTLVDTKGWGHQLWTIITTQKGGVMMSQ